MIRWWRIEGSAVGRHVLHLRAVAADAYGFCLPRNKDCRRCGEDVQGLGLRVSISTEITWFPQLTSGSRLPSPTIPPGTQINDHSFVFSGNCIGIGYIFVSDGRLCIQFSPSELSYSLALLAYVPMVARLQLVGSTNVPELRVFI